MLRSLLVSVVTSGLSRLRRRGRARDKAEHAYETADRLEAGLRQAGTTVFARIDYAQSAHDNGLELNPMVLILFGNPKAGTPLMARSPTIGVDLAGKLSAPEDN